LSTTYCPGWCFRVVSRRIGFIVEPASAQGYCEPERGFDLGRDAERQPIALVLGFSIHGLAVARALHSSGIEVHAVSETGDLPTCKTSVATVHVDERIKSLDAISCLLDLRRKIPRDRNLVLFPTNDKIVGVLAERWDELDDTFRLSWSDCRDRVRDLIRKDGFASFVEDNGLLAPRSRILRDGAGVRPVLEELRAPVIVKPVVPLGTFKALRYSSLDQAAADVDRWAPEYPVIVQEWIEGDDTDLLFASYFLDRGEVTAEFSGRKLLSAPRALGQGVIVEDYWDDELSRQGRDVARALAVSGPVAVEFKRGNDGQLWLIEANVGRTEYSVDLLIGSGLNLPAIEYDYVCGNTQAQDPAVARRNVTWLDTEKEPLALLKYFAYTRRHKESINKLVFPYFGHRDFGPLMAATMVFGKRALKAIVRRMSKPLSYLKLRFRGA